MSTKNKLLSFLKGKKSIWVSGESLSREMDVSRAAIWKHIHRLKEEGYVIDSSRNKGYLFRQSSDRLLGNEILESLSTRIFGKQNIFHFMETDSTNLRAKSLAERGAPEGTVVVAELQTEGKGRRGRTWFSPPGEGLYVSLILRPAITPNDASKLTLMSAVAVVETLLTITPLAVRIKWPNDIMVHGKKLAGILTQVSTDMDIVDYAIIGLGLNINTAQDGFPDNLKGVATSILLETGAVFPRVNLLRSYLESFEKWYDVLKTSGFQIVLERWRELSDIIGCRVRVDLPNHQHIGKVIDIDRDGFLLLQDQQGTIQKIMSGEISRLDQPS
jgi:BirA family biotin operon repressor/biotin-[acetyl-CoA-carboxylase] ligase